jgi:DNA-binding response OmpR family regulator
LPKVLVVDDEDMIRSALTKILVSQGYDVFLARNGKEGLLACRDLPDIVILDVDMPGLSGFKVLEALREEPDTKNLPVVMLTSTPPLQGEQLAMNLGVSHYLTKPWTLGMVESVVRVALWEAKVARGETGDTSGYLKPTRKKKKKVKAERKTHPDIIMPDKGDTSDTSPDD